MKEDCEYKEDIVHIKTKSIEFSFKLERGIYCSFEKKILDNCKNCKLYK